MRCLKSVLIKLSRENDVPRNSLSYQVIPSQPTVLGCFHSTHDCCMTLANALTKNHRARSNINSRDLCCLVLCSCIPVSFSRASAAHRLDIILSLAFFRSLALSLCRSRSSTTRNSLSARSRAQPFGTFYVCNSFKSIEICVYFWLRSQLGLHIVSF